MTLKIETLSAVNTEVGNQFTFAGVQLMRIAVPGNYEFYGVPCVRIEGRLLGFVMILNADDSVEMFSE